MDHLGALIEDRTARFAARPAMRFHDGQAWQQITYLELGRRIRTAAAGLVAAGVAAGDRVGILSPNRPEWAIADFAILTAGAVSVPIYATNTPEQVRYLIEDAGIRVLFVADQAQLDKVMAVWASVPDLAHVVAFDPATQTTDPRTESYQDLLAKGAAAGAETEARLAERLAGAGPQDVATIVYTSGTTGEPKGVMLAHASFFHQLQALDERFTIGPTDVSLCFLPLSHVLERGWSFYVFAKGAENCYVRDPRAVVEALGEIRPTAMVSVPRLFEKLHAGILDRVERGGALRARLFGWALTVGGRYQHALAAGDAPGPLLKAEHALADRLVLGQVRDAVGGHKKVFAAGGAPLSPDIEEFFLAAGILICQGYGLTETTAMSTCNHPKAFRFGTVGTPVRGTEIRIAPDGEIQVRGANVMLGYHGRPDETAAAFDDGWFRTGDVGDLDADGFLRVTDRIKDLIITSQGKNVAPQRVEGILTSDPYIEQAVVIGDRRTYLTALIEPAFALLERYADEHAVPYASPADLVERPEIRRLFDDRIAAASRDLAPYEQVKRYTLVATPFTQEAGQLTPTLKLRRRAVEAEFAAVIDAMYAAPSGQPPAAG